MKSNILLAVVASFFVANSFGQIKILSGGAIGLGTETPVHPVQINHPRTDFSNLSNTPFRIELANGNPRLTSTSKVVFYNTSHTQHIDVEAKAFLQVSDERLKTNISKLSGEGRSALGTVLALNGYSYAWQALTSKSEGLGGVQLHEIGFLAQEVEKIIPSAVQTNDSTGMKSMSYMQVVPYLVEGMKEQQAIIEELKARLQELEANKTVRKEEEYDASISLARQKN